MLVHMIVVLLVYTTTVNIVNQYKHLLEGLDIKMADRTNIYLALTSGHMKKTSGFINHNFPTEYLIVL